MNKSVKHIGFLDQVRGMAVLSVFLTHCLGTTFAFTNLPWNGWVRSITVGRYVVPDSFLVLLPAVWGWAGVPIFFVVSGFCIHMSFQQQGKQWGNFFIRRFFRIYPPYLASIVFCVLLKNQASLFNADGGMQLWTHLLLIHNYFSATNQGINPVFWSVAVEVQLYLIYPLLIMLVSKLGWKRTMFITAAFEVSIRVLEGLFAVTDYGKIPLVGRLGTLCMSPLGFWFSWSIGALIAEAVLQGKPIPLGKVSPLLWMILAMETTLIKPLEPFSFLLFSLAAAAAISRILSGTFPKISLPKVALLGLKQAGIWSYSIYLLHVPLLRIFVRSIYVFYSDIYDYPIPMFLVCLIIGLPIVLIGGLWYRLFELPGIAWGRRIIRSRLAGKAL